MFLGTKAWASFPVQHTGKAEAGKTAVITKGEIDKKVRTEITAISKSELEKNVQNRGGGGNDTLILVLLWFFLGWAAAHRWYAGKPAGMNILFILTAGGCGIWAIIDLIKILTGEFK